MFSPYEKIEENLLNRQLTQEHYRLIQKTEWVVTEKIHGANFCVILDSQGITYAKRKAILAPDDDFFGYQDAVAPLELAFLQMQEWLQQGGFASVKDTILVYGELCGGGYPHPDVEPNPLVDLVQTGVYYSPNIEFCVFDVAVQSSDTTQPKAYLDYKLVLEMCQKANLLYTEALFVGSYEEALRVDIHFESKLPNRLNLPKLPFPNKAEGVVIKPRQNLYLATEKEAFRPVLKHKIAEFSEVQFHQSEKWDAFTPKGKTTQLLRNLLQLVNRNRLVNAASKIGKIKPNDAQKTAQLKRYFQEDIQDEIRKSFAKDFAKLTQSEKETVEWQLHAAMDELLKEYVK